MQYTCATQECIWNQVVVSSISTVVVIPTQPDVSSRMPLVYLLLDMLRTLTALHLLTDQSLLWRRRVPTPGLVNSISAPSLSSTCNWRGIHLVHIFTITATTTPIEVLPQPPSPPPISPPGIYPCPHPHCNPNPHPHFRPCRLRYSHILLAQPPCSQDLFMSCWSQFSLAPSVTLHPLWTACSTQGSVRQADLEHGPKVGQWQSCRCGR